MFRLEIESGFAAAHQLRAYKGKCENLHGHNWRVRLAVTGTELDSAGMLVDFGVLKKILNSCTAKLDHCFLNDCAPFDGINPTSENLARFLAEEVGRQLPQGVMVDAVTVWESEKCSATYFSEASGVRR